MSSETSAPDVRLPDLMLRVAVAVVLFVAGTWWAMGRMVAEKIATALVMPSGLIWLLLFVAILAARRAQRNDLMVACALPWLVVTLMGNGIVLEYAATEIERPWRQIDPLQVEPCDAVVVLGGGTLTGGNGRVQANSSGDRIVLGAQLYHAGITPRLYCTGRRIEELYPDANDPATEAFELLTSLNVPADTIEILEGRNTSEEMKLLSAKFGDTDARIGVVTSAWHLRRAMQLAAKNGLNPVPLPADFMSSPERNVPMSAYILDCIPQDSNLWGMAKLCKEFLGSLVGR